MFILVQDYSPELCADYRSHRIVGVYECRYTAQKAMEKEIEWLCEENYCVTDQGDGWAELYLNGDKDSPKWMGFVIERLMYVDEESPLSGLHIVAVDFDGTLCTDKYPFMGEPNTKLIQYLIDKRANDDNYRIILWTCRTGDELKMAVNWCEWQGLKFDAVNENLPEAIQAFGGDTRKIYADEYIDDANKWFYINGK